METLQIIWFFLILVLFMGYSILDGFDLGVGILFPFVAKNEEEKKELISFIAPFWDGNEVWLLTGVGALFAAFPPAYATALSGFYPLVMILIFSLIMRAVSIEYRGLSEKKKFWDMGFTLGSISATLFFGIILGNIICGIPIELIKGDKEFSGNFFTFFRLFPLLTGFLAVSAFVLHGSTYTLMKTNGILKQRAKKAILLLLILCAIFFILASITGIFSEKLPSNKIISWAFMFLTFFSFLIVMISKDSMREHLPFWGSSLLIFSIWGIIGSVHFPNIIRASNRPDLNLTIYNSSSTKLTLTLMLIIAVIGMPLVIFYTAYVYRILRRFDK